MTSYVYSWRICCFYWSSPLAAPLGRPCWQRLPSGIYNNCDVH